MAKSREEQEQGPSGSMEARAERAEAATVPAPGPLAKSILQERKLRKQGSLRGWPGPEGSQEEQEAQERIQSPTPLAHGTGTGGQKFLELMPSLPDEKMEAKSTPEFSTMWPISPWGSLAWGPVGKASQSLRGRQQGP